MLLVITYIGVIYSINDSSKYFNFIIFYKYVASYKAIIGFVNKNVVNLGHLDNRTLVHS